MRTNDEFEGALDSRKSIHRSQDHLPICFRLERKIGNNKAQEELTKNQIRYKKNYDKKTGPIS